MPARETIAPIARFWPGWRRIRRRWNAAFKNKFPTRSGNLLNLRDLEQGLENLKRLPTVEADLSFP
ncbi:POTRA domain-containing protein [Neisseria sp. P0008.S010]|uniref:POTRA domain-containing protein n=1 Tax=Neisseria sp. P0008.S010 TaxID=3436707 RepID=UPI003F80A018